MAWVLLLLFVGGIGLTQAVSDPHAVTLRWLRLGGLIALTLWALAVVVYAITAEQPTRAEWIGLAVVAVPVIAQLMLTQLGKRAAQRIAAAAAYLAACGVGYFMWIGMTAAAGDAANAGPGAISLLTLGLSSGLLGGFLMTMLLGHAYLTAGNEMTQAPFERLVRVLLVLLAARLLLSAGFGLYPWFTAVEERPARRLWTVMMITARYLVGLAVPIVFTLMTWECVRRRANQSATGIIYVASVLVVIGEGLALALQPTVGEGV